MIYFDDSETPLVCMIIEPRMYRVKDFVSAHSVAHFRA